MGILISLLFLLITAKLYATESSNYKRPHIVFLLADDLGWHDVSFHGSKQIPTPNIDALARDGIIMNRYYVQQSCSPSRGSLLTGKYPLRLGLQHFVILADAPWGLPLNETLLPQYLKVFNYSTHAVGKWHLGFYKDAYLPTQRGFDSFFGYYSGLEDYYTHVSKVSYMSGLDLHHDFPDQEKHECVERYNGTYGSDLFTEKAKKVIFEHNSSEPLFLYFAQQSSHSGNFDDPLEAPKRYVEPMVGIDDEKRKIFAGMVSSLDHSVGEIFAALDTADMLDDTIFIFSADNGGIPQVEDGSSGSNWPLKGCKFTLWEGGVRGVSFAWSPFLRQRSRIYDDLMHITDWLPTILSAVGGEEALTMLPSDIDGINQWPTIAYDFPPPRSEVIVNLDDKGHYSGIIKGRYKLVNGTYNDGVYDRWYNQDGDNSSVSHSPPPKPNKEVYYENYFRFLQKSKVAAILWRKYGRDPLLAASCVTQLCVDLLEVNCGHYEPAVPICNSTAAPCLYDILADPCEYYNIAPLYPDVQAELIKDILEYRAVEIPAADAPQDPAANPDYYGGCWVPWESV